jgi:membrane associated rhomboid family serine protease
MTELVAVRASPDRETVEGWALVLMAAGLHAAVVRGEPLWTLVVDAAEVDAALVEFDAADREQRRRALEPEHAPEYGRTRIGIVLAVAPLLFFAWTGPYDRDAIWFAAGSADAEAILDGELWRSVTALTLHSDVLHVLANALSICLFATLLFRSVGPGVGTLVVLAAGASGNLLNALLHMRDHVSVGASTAVFGSIGALCGLQFARRWRVRRLRLRRGGAWLPLAAGLGLLAMIGTAGERTDISAHFLGLVCGVPFGAGASLLVGPPRPIAQSLSLAVSALSVVLAWALALGQA